MSSSAGPHIGKDTNAFFETLAEQMGQVINHDSPLTITGRHFAAHQEFFGSRFALSNAKTVARAYGYPDIPLDDTTTFHAVFGQTVEQISLRSKGNLGYANGLWWAPVYLGDTLSASSKVIGSKRNSDGKNGIIYVETTGVKEDGTEVLKYNRWVLTPTLGEKSDAEQTVIPKFSEAVSYENLAQVGCMPTFDPKNQNTLLRANSIGFEDYNAGDVVLHNRGRVITPSMHMMYTNLMLNGAQVHFSPDYVAEVRPGETEPVVYGGHIINMARAATHHGVLLNGAPSGFPNAHRIVALHGGDHLNPAHAGDIVYAASKILSKGDLNESWGAVTLETVAAKGKLADFPIKTESKYPSNILLSMRYTVAVPKLASLRGGPA